jgi:hypothetical protein
MAPETGTALLIIGVFVLPGFITLLFRERTYTVKGQETPFERLLSALYYSAIIFSLLGAGAVLVGIDRDQISDLYGGRYSLSTYLLLALVGLFLLPLAIAECGRRWQRSLKLRPWVLGRAKVDPGHGVPAAWEQLFLESKGVKEGRGLLLRVTLEDGRVVGGLFGRNSLASYTAHSRDLFIEERWMLNENHWFEQPAPATRGLWIAAEQIRSVEVYSPGD